MNTAFRQLFWGFLFTLFEIHLIVIDILPEPVGYGLIIAGLNKIMEQFPYFQTAKKTAGVLAVVSIPTVFIQETSNGAITSNAAMIGGMTYDVLLSLIHLFLVFELFRGLIELAAEIEEIPLKVRTEKTFQVYMWISMTMLFLLTFSINLFDVPASILLIVGGIVWLIMEIVFLVLLAAYRRAF
ncbi:MAG: hypothetical protein H0Z32_10510 [Bacillaceae bacterium]|nr:hypothetical protein [Bacillaceae bacterium]